MISETEFKTFYCIKQLLWYDVLFMINRVLSTNMYIFITKKKKKLGTKPELIFTIT